MLFCRDQVVVDGLAAAQQIHIRIGADLSEDIRSLLGMLFLHIGTVVDGDVFLAFVTDLFGQGAQQHLFQAISRLNISPFLHEKDEALETPTKICYYRFIDDDSMRFIVL